MRRHYHAHVVRVTTMHTLYVQMFAIVVHMYTRKIFAHSMHTHVMYTYNIQQFFLCLHVRCLKFHVCMRMQHMCKHLCIHMQHAYVYTRNTCVNIFCLHVRFHTCGTSKQLTCKQEKSSHT